MGLLYGRAGRLTAQNGGFRPGQFVGYAYGPAGDYNPMRALPARVINATHLTCETVRLNNPAPAAVKVSMDGGVSWVTTSGTAPSVSILPLVEVAVGRRPYTSEAEGQLIVKVAGPFSTFSV